MKFKLTFFILFIFYNAYLLHSQSIPYFQQEVNYDISVTLDDKKDMLHGFIEIEYINNSPNTLDSMYFHLWPNAYKNNETAFAQQYFKLQGKSKLFRVDSNRGFIDSLNFKINENEVIWKYDVGHIDIAKIFLNEPLNPGNRMIITTPFRVKLPPSGISRLGHSEQSYQITQWYPKPAVYDNRGWHPMPYLDIGEFYSEFGSFDVKITLPNDYIVAASGDLITKSEIEWLNSLANQNKDEISANVIPERGTKKSKTLRYRLNNAHDFAWFANKNFVVDKDSIQLPSTGKTVYTWAFYPPDKERLWNTAINYVTDAVLFFSEKVGEYPYGNCSAVSGPLGIGGGMEYPGITIIGQINDTLALQLSIMHEVVHNWFYGALGSNERVHPFLDEGLTSYHEMLYMMSMYPDLELRQFANLNTNQAKFLNIHGLNLDHYYFLPYEIIGRMNFDQHNLLHSTDYTLYNYFAIVYLKSAMALNYLREYAGDSKMDKAIQNYYEQWKFKHPYPKDFRKSLEESLDENIDWLFDQILTTTRTVDYKIKRVKGDSVLVRNAGTVQSPFVIDVINENNKVFSKWHKGIEDQQWLSIPDMETDKIVLDHDLVTTDLYRNNNYYNTKGFNKQFEPLQLKFLVGLENPARTTIYYAPLIGWNNYNKTMAGLWLHSGLVKKKRVEYQLLPLYGFGNKDLAGTARFNIFFPFQGGIFRNIDLSISGVRYGYTHDASFNRLSVGVKFLINNALNKKTLNTLKARYTLASDMQYLIDDELDPPYDHFYNLAFEHEQKRRVNPYSISAQIASGLNFLKASLEAKYKISYITRGGLDIRLFGGKMLVNNNPSSIYHFSLIGNTGVRDYTFDYVFLNRFGTYSDGLFTRQFVPSDAGFASFYPGGFSDDWMGALNVTSSIPKIPFVKPFINGAFTIVDEYYMEDNFFYEGGIKLGGENVAIYFPMFSSDEISTYLSDNTGSYWERVRFVLRLEKLNPFHLRDLILFSM